MRSFSILLLIALCATPLLVLADESATVDSTGTGRLLVQKSLDSNKLMPWNYALDTPINVTISVFNIGDGSAYDVTLEDSWSDFELQGSNGVQQWDEIPAGQTVTVQYFVKPTREQEFESSPARITYQPKQDGPTVTGYSSSITNLNVISSEQFAKLTDTHVVQWGVVAAFFALFLVVPAAKYYEISSSFKTGRRKAE